MCTQPQSPFRLAKPSKLFEELLREHRVGLIAVDESHLIKSFLRVFNSCLLHEYSVPWQCLTVNLYLQAFVCLDWEPASHQSRGVPIMCLTATAAPRVVDELLQMLRDSALVEKSSVIPPNIACAFCEAAKTG